MSEKEDYIVHTEPKERLKGTLIINEVDEKDAGYILGFTHWKYIEKLLRVHGEDEKVIEKIKFHYIQAMKHGYKHGCNGIKEVSK